MKIRIGFISNSSSSSFIVKFKQKIPQEILKNKYGVYETDQEDKVCVRVEYGGEEQMGGFLKLLRDMGIVVSWVNEE